MKTSGRLSALCLPSCERWNYGGEPDVMDYSEGAVSQEGGGTFQGGGVRQDTARPGAG